jgi:aminopeptidase N
LQNFTICFEQTNHKLNAMSKSPITYRADYTAPNYWVDTVEMGFDLHPTATRIATRSTIRHRKGAPRSLEWAGDGAKGGVTLDFIEVDGKRLSKKEYSLKNDVLTIPNLPATAVVDIATTVNPTANTTLMGLYASQGNLFTQCEAQGFRRMTYFADRPDVMSRYTVMLRGDKALYPVLLSNGNLLKAGDLDGGQHYALWQDPHLKPSYLFAVVAGDLVANEAWVKNPAVATGKSLLQIYTRPSDQAATQWALDSLKASITWDLKTFGRPLDLERYMVVAVGDFNMGAMENKGLNVFNTAYVLAQPDTATDTDYANIEAVIGHEYFHNWTGNRITCRDWFQLTLKEGLTVYRDQTFSMDMAAQGLSKTAAASARAVRRIEDVATLRAAQFGEDSGPMAHPVRPDSFEDISNFYTATVYEKGAEVIRMQALLANAASKDGFRKGMDTYFARHDGQAVTCDDFLNAIADGSGADLKQFKRWYEQAGTPVVAASGRYDAKAKTYSLSLKQSNAPVGIEPKAAKKLPLHIPVRVGLLAANGNELKTKLNGNAATEHLVHLKAATQTFVFEGVASEPTPSLLRGFSAPVKLSFTYSDAQLAVMLGHDTDAFNRWEAAQRLYERLIVAQYEGQPLPAETLHVALAKALNDAALDNAFKAVLLAAPSYNLLADAVGANLRPQALFAAREAVLNGVALALKQQWAALHRSLTITAPYSADAVQSGQRSLRNAALMMWLRTADAGAVAAASAQYQGATNMTDRIAALGGLVYYKPDAVQKPLADFYTRYANNDLVIDKWFALQAANPLTSVAQIEALLAHKAFKWETPNRMRSVVFRFCMGNPAAFHSQVGYAFWLACLEKLIAVNPEVAARLARAMDHWKRHDTALAAAMKSAVGKALKLKALPKGVAEVLHKAMA